MDLATGRSIRSESGSNVSATMTNCSFPLHDAARQGHQRVVRLLLERGHSASTLDDAGLRPSDRAREAGHYDLADELEHREVEHSLGSAARSEIERLSIKELFGLVQGKPEVVAGLIIARRIHAIDGKGDTPLHICAALGRLQFCDQLIKGGADPAAMNFERKKPHDRAAENGHAMVAGLLRNLLTGESHEITDSPVTKPIIAKSATNASEPFSETAEDSLDFDDFDLDFDGEDEAENFHRDIERNSYVASFEPVVGRVTRLADEDGSDLEFEGLGDRGFRIDAEDVVGPLPQTAEYAEAATFRSFLDVRKRRWSSGRGEAPSTRFFATPFEVIEEWSSLFMEQEYCTEDEIDELIGQVRGSFDAETLRGNLLRELNGIGLLRQADEEAGLDVSIYPLPDIEDIVDLLSCICNGSNMLPGMELKPLRADVERRLFDEFSSAKEEICRILISDSSLVSVVVMLGELVETGTEASAKLTDLDIQLGGKTNDADLLSAALSYLVGYHTLIEDDEATEEDRDNAVESVSALKLSETAIDLILKGLEVSSVMDETRFRLADAVSCRAAALNKIAVLHLPFIRRLASRQFGPDEMEDAFQEGFFGLMRSIERLDRTLGNRLMTYAQFSVRQRMAKARLDSGALIRLPVHVAERLRKARAAVEYLPLNTDGDKLQAVLIEKAELSLRKFEILDNVSREHVELGDLATALDVSSDRQIDHFFQAELSERMREVMAGLDSRKRDILEMRFGFGDLDEHTLEECGQKYGVTRERIRQIEAKALKQLKHPSHSRKLREFIS